ncbi:MAG TPA: hypothetical protein VG498_00145 [Terriglobales bacterium]|nr:hypothetical protein [Terriglobales bacterium]
MRLLLLLLTIFAGSTCLRAQQAEPKHNSNSQPTQGMDAMSMHSHSLIQSIEHHVTAGTDVEPNSTPVEMLMFMQGDWMLMLHGMAFLTDIQQSGGRGRDKLFAPNWVMPMVQRNLGNGILTLRAMLSLEPATISRRQYPLLFQQGETAFGRPIVDGQHPHDFIMELAAIYDYRVGDRTLLSVYVAPTGDPVLGPPAYAHRTSASENPVAALSHHLQDSTHIAANVITVGITHGGVRFEASGFHGREPDEFRWNIDSGMIDSWATRVTVSPAPNWTMQYSIGQLHSPEELARDEDVRRMTASIIYNRPFRDGNWASTLVWGRNQSLENGNIGNSYLLESNVQFGRNHVWTRIENVDRTNELLLGENPLPVGFVERYFTRVQAYTAGYDRDIGHIPYLASTIGTQLTWYGVSQVLKPLYGTHPVGANVFLRLRLRGN